MINFYRDKLYQVKYIKSINEYLKHINENPDENDVTAEQTEEAEKPIGLWKVTIYDVLTNSDMNKLVKSLYKLNDKEYTKKINLRRRKSKALQYMRLEISHTTSGILADIDFNNHDFIKTLSLRYTQITNQTIAIQYNFNFKKALLETETRNFIKDNIKSTYFTNFTSIFNNDIDDFLDQREDQYLRDIFQAFIVKNLYSNYGKNYQLPMGFTINYEKSEEWEKVLKNPFLILSLYNKKEDYYILLDTIVNKVTFNLYFSGRSIPQIPFLTNFQYSGNEFYYFIFRYIEDIELNKKVTKYLLGNYKIVKKKDYLWLVNKLRAIKDSDFKANYPKERIKSEDWEIRYDDKIDKEMFLTGKKFTLKYTKIYTEYHDYMKTLLTTQNDTIVLLVGSFTLIFTVLGIMVTLFLQ